MKKSIILFTLLLGYLANAQVSTQNNDSGKFQLGVGYAFQIQSKSYTIFKNPPNVFINYQLKRWNSIDLSVGARVFLFMPRPENKDNFSTPWGFNPNVSSSYSFLDNKFRAYLALGYYFDQYQFTTTASLGSPSASSTIRDNGITFTPGIKYFVKSNLFLDINYMLLNIKTNVISDTSSKSLFCLGFGVAF